MPRADNSIPGISTSGLQESSRVAGKEFHLGQRPSLDGLRGVAILLVLLVHSGLFKTTFGFIGVDLFFVLSGFLITCLLLEEMDQTNGISLRNFYARRALRLLPALLVVLTAFVTFSAITCQQKEFLRNLKESLTALFYSTNWAMAFDLVHFDCLGHTWSLSIEEQFYILWPAILLLLLRHATRTAIFRLVLIGALLSWLTRSLLFLGTTAGRERLFFGLDTRADALLLGCAVGVAFSAGLIPNSETTRRIARRSAYISMAGLVVIGLCFPMASPSMYLLGWFLVSLFSALILLQVIVAPESLIGRILANRTLTFAGKVSYGLYLWHYPIVRFIQDQHWPWWKNVLIGLPAITLIPLASYYLLERPCLSLKNRFRPTPAPDSKGGRPLAGTGEQIVKSA